MNKSLINTTILALALSVGGPVFAEMKGSEKGMDMKSQNQAQQRIESKGVVNKVSPSENKVVLNHEPIPELSWPAMKMGFKTAEDLDLDALKKGDAVRFVIETRQGKNIITDIEKTQ